MTLFRSQSARMIGWPTISADERPLSTRDMCWGEGDEALSTVYRDERTVCICASLSTRNSLIHTYTTQRLQHQKRYWLLVEVSIRAAHSPWPQWSIRGIWRLDVHTQPTQASPPHPSNALRMPWDVVPHPPSNIFIIGSISAGWD